MPTLLERVADGDVALPLGGPQLAVLDTGVIYNDIVQQLRHGRAEGVVLGSARLGATRLFAADHVYDEVYERLDGFERRGVTRDAVLKFFEQHYLPRLRFVTAPAGFPTERVARVTHQADVPTAVLCELIAPVLPLAEDPHLLDVGFGLEDWLDRMIAAKEVLDHDQVLVLLIHSAHKAGGWAVRRARNEAATTRPRELVAGAAIGLGVLLLLPRLASAVTDLASALARGGATIAGGAVLGTGQLLAARSRLTADLVAASLAPPAVPSLVNQVARALSSAVEPLSVQAIAAEPGRDVEAIAEILERHPAFVSTPGGWQLGRHLAPRSSRPDRGDL
jgi:hypothetical protein